MRRRDLITRRPNTTLTQLLVALLLMVGWIPGMTGNALAFDDEPDDEWILNTGDDGMMGGEITEAFGKEFKRDHEPESYQRRFVSVTLWRGISPWGSNSENVINHIVIGLSKDEMARLEGIGVGLLSSLAYEHVYGFQYGTFAAVAGEEMAGIQLSLVGSVAGTNSLGAQIGGIGAVAGADAYLLQAGGLGAVAGRDMIGAQIGGMGAVVGRNLGGLQFSVFGAVAGKDAIGAQAGGFAAVTGRDIIGMQFSGIGAVAGRDMRGVQFGGIAAVAGGNVEFLQIGGIAAVAGLNLHGVQAAGLAAVSAGDSYGATIAGLAGVVDGDFIGIQGAGLVNAVTGSLYGIQLGSINFAADQRSLQVGAINAAEVLSGVQLGLSNGVFDNNGLIVGLWNHIEGEANGVHIGAITQIEGEPRAFNLYYESSGFANIDYITGNRKIRSILSVGFSNWSDPSRWMIGGGIGHQMTLLPDRLDMEVDLLGYKMNDNEFWTDGQNYLTRLRSTFLLRYSDSNSIYFGASYNYLTSQVSDGSDIEVIALSDKIDGDWFHRSWIGYEIGIQIGFDRIDFWKMVY